MLKERMADSREETDKRYRRYVQELRYIDDSFMSIALNDKITVQEVLNAILDFPVEVTRVESQRTENRLYGRGVRLDVIARDKNGKFYNIEIQRANEGANVHRARYNASILDTVVSNKGEDFKSLPDTYIIFITEKDVFKAGFQLYHIDHIIRETNETCDDGQHIVYVNGACQSDTEIGRIMHDFQCRQAEDMYNKVLAGRMEDIKGDEKEVRRMCEIMEKIQNEGREEGREEGRLSALLNSVQSVMKNSKMTVVQAMDLLSVTDKAEREYIQKHIGG